MAAFHRSCSHAGGELRSIPQQLDRASVLTWALDVRVSVDELRRIDGGLSAVDDAMIAPSSFLTSPPRHSLRSADWTKRMLIGLGLVCMIGLTGCATGDYAYVKTIATGERIQIPLEKGSPALARKGTVGILHAGLVPNTAPDQKELYYLFILDDKSPTAPRSVKVEDVTEDNVVLMVDDQKPEFVSQRWSGKSRMFDGNDPHLVWITQLGDTMRVFRFTVTAADGSTTVLDQGWMVPAWAKVPMRRALGLK
jgi:hypothetical protein